MKVRALTAALVLVFLVVGGGLITLGSWDLPAPSKTVEKVVPDARFPR